MEKELNIAAILKDKPAGTKLWSPIFGNCKFSRLSDSGIRVSPIHNGFTSTEEKPFFVTGQYTLAGEVCLFPSKQMQDWSKFAWKRGDVIADDCGNYSIFVEFDKGTGYANVVLDFLCNLDDDEIDYDGGKSSYPTQDWSKVPDEKAKKVISHIEKCLGGKLNLETLEIEKPKQEFKDGNIVVVDKNKEMNLDKIIAIYNDGDILLGFNSYAYLNVSLEKLNFCSEVLVCGRTPRLASEEENQQLFDALAKEGKRWNPDTKLFEDLPKKCEFKPTDWCLMKDSTKYWELCQFAYTRKVHGTTIYSAVGGLIYYKCIPYNEETKHLLGTTDEWKGGE